MQGLPVEIWLHIFTLIPRHVFPRKELSLVCHEFNTIVDGIARCQCKWCTMIVRDEDIELLIESVGISRNEAVFALKVNDSDIFITMMQFFFNEGFSPTDFE